MRQLIHNSIQTPDGTILVSRSQHDFVQYVDANSKTYMVDGGRVYLRRSDNGDEVELSLYTDAPHEQIREVFTWGTYGKEGDQPLKFRLLRELSDNHIAAILETQSHMPDYMKEVFMNEQHYRATTGE